MTDIQPELWIHRAGEAVAFYAAAFGATVLHRVGAGDDIVAQLAVGDAAFWVASSSARARRFSPAALGGATGRTLLVVEDPDAVVRQALAAGATQLSAPADEHGWRIGRVADPFGHEWEIATPLGDWPPGGAGAGQEAAAAGDEDASRVFRPAGISYLRIPAQDPQASAAFYRDVFGWRVDGARPEPSFEDGSGHVIGHLVPGAAVAGEAGVRPYVYVESVDDTLRRALAHGGAVLEAPYAEGDLRVATFGDPAGNAIGVWQRS